MVRIASAVNPSIPSDGIQQAFGCLYFLVKQNADAITARICIYLKDDMMGCRNGVVAQLKRITSSAVGVHCAAHGLNLSSSQAGDCVPYINQLFDFYANSAVCTAGLEAIQSFIQEKQGKILEPCSTRWLSIERSVHRIKGSVRYRAKAA